MDYATSTYDDTTDDDLPSANLSINSGMKLEFRHVSDLVNGSLSSAVPKQNKTWPHVLEDFSLETSTTTKQYDLIAWITGLMKDDVADPYARIDLPYLQGGPIIRWDLVMTA